MLTIRETLYIREPTVFGDDAQRVEIGAFTVIEATDEHPVKFLGSARVGHQCHITYNRSKPGELVIGRDAIIDSQCFIGGNTMIGDTSQILYGAKVFEGVTIGAGSLIGSDVSNWTKIGDYVTFMGHIAHSNRTIQGPAEWNTDDHPAPTIENYAFVGEGAILIGGIVIGEGAYVAAGETVRCDVPPRTFVLNGRMRALSNMRGFIKTRGPK